MSRVSVIEELYSSKRKSALEFNYDKLWAPPILSILTPQDVQELTRIATSLKYNANIDLKYKLIDAVMVRRGFKRAHCGTNRVVYNFLEDPRFVAKVAIDKVGMRDTPAEFKNQEFLKPFCCKIFEVSPNGVIGFVERVNPVSSLEEFISIADDVFNMMITKIIGKYVVDDLGTTKFLNIGVRTNAQGCSFGPVVIDFPYVFELDGRKLICNRKIKTPQGDFICGGEIDYDDGLNYLRCTKCGKTYKARELARNTKDVLIINEDGGSGLIMRSRIVDENGKVLLDSGLTSKTYASKEQCKPFVSSETEPMVRKVVKRRMHKGRVDKLNTAMNYYTKLQLENMAPESLGNTVIKEDNVKKVRTVIKPNGVKKELIDSEEVVKEPKDINKQTETTNDEPIMRPVNITPHSTQVENAETEDNVEESIVDNKDSVEESIVDNKDNVDQDDENKKESSDDNLENIIDSNSNEAINTILNNLFYNKFDEPDYSNYEPEEKNNVDDYNEDNEEIEYEQYIDKKRKNNKHKKRAKYDSQLEDY